MAFDQKSGFPNSKSAIPSAAEKEAALAKKADKKGKSPLVIVGLVGATAAAAAAGFFALSKGGSEAPDPNATQPTATAPATPNATSSPTPEAPNTPVNNNLPEVSNEGLDIASLAEAQEIADATQRGAVTPIEPFIAAANGDSSMLDAMHIDISEVVVNYQLNALYLEKAKGLIGQAKTEVSANTTRFNLAVNTENYDFTRATQYVLGELITQYGAGEQPQLDTEYALCMGETETDLTTPNGKNVSGLIPALGITSLIKESFCPTNSQYLDDFSHLFAASAVSNINYAQQAGFPTIVKLAKVEAKVSNGEYPEAKATIAAFKKKITK